MYYAAGFVGLGAPDAHRSPRLPEQPAASSLLD